MASALGGRCSEVAGGRSIGSRGGCISSPGRAALGPLQVSGGLGKELREIVGARKGLWLPQIN